MSGKSNLNVMFTVMIPLEHENIISNLSKRFKQQPKMKINYENNSCSLVLTWTEETPTPNTQYGQLLPTSQALNSFYNSTPYQRLIAMQHLLNQTR